MRSSVIGFGRGWPRRRAISDLERLLDLATVLDPAFASLDAQVCGLDPYAVAVRYPDTLGVEFPPTAEVAAAIEHAQAVLDFVLRLLPETVQPGTRRPSQDEGSHRRGGAEPDHD